MKRISYLKFASTLFVLFQVQCLASTLPDDLELSDFEPYVEGNNRCYMSQGFFPVETLEGILPKHFSVPDADTMNEHYSDVAVVEGMHPFLLSFCHGAEIHDMRTKINVPE